MLCTQNTSGQVTNFYGNTIGATYETEKKLEKKFPNSLVIITKYEILPDATWFPFVAISEWTRRRSCSISMKQ